MNTDNLKENVYISSASHFGNVVKSILLLYVHGNRQTLAVGIRSNSIHTRTERAANASLEKQWISTQPIHLFSLPQELRR